MSRRSARHRDGYSTAWYISAIAGVDQLHGVRAAVAGDKNPSQRADHHWTGTDGELHSQPAVEIIAQGALNIAGQNGVEVPAEATVTLTAAEVLLAFKLSVAVAVKL